MENNQQGTTALITGASSGIGRELARVFATNGHNLIITGRSEAELQALAQELTSQKGITVDIVIKDLFVPGAADELYSEVKALGRQVDILVNDAGQGVYGKFATETDLADELNIIQLNIVALTILTKRFVADMVARGSGRVLQVASVVSKVPSPLQSVYGGTKGYVYNFTQGLRNELKDTGVTITALQPGVTDTDFFNKAGAMDSKIVEGDMADPADVAKDGYDALMAGDDHVVSGMKNKMQMTMANVTPDTVLAAQLRAQSERKDEE